MLNNLLLKKITVFASPILLFFLWELWLNWERAAIEIGIATLIIIVVTIWYLTLRPLAISQLRNDLHHQESWRFFITPGFLVLGLFLFLLIIESRLAQHLIILGGNALLLLLLQNLFDRFYRGNNYPAQSFESISGNINSLSLFLLVAVFYSFSTFLNLPIWFLAFALLITATLLTYQMMWIAGLNLKKSWLYVLVIDVIVVEIFWALLFLPNTFYVKALVLTVVYYLSVNLSRNYLIDILNQKMIWRYLIIGGVVLGVVLATAQWL